MASRAGSHAPVRSGSSCQTDSVAPARHQGTEDRGFPGPSSGHTALQRWGGLKPAQALLPCKLQVSRHHEAKHHQTQLFMEVKANNWLAAATTQSSEEMRSADRRVPAEPGEAAAPRHCPQRCRSSETSGTTPRNDDHDCAWMPSPPGTPQL